MSGYLLIRVLLYCARDALVGVGMSRCNQKEFRFIAFLIPRWFVVFVVIVVVVVVV